jgi:glycosyltransferase involved in cell wall biosynthesis
MRFILIGNYLLDKQESMERYAQMLDAGFNKAGYNTEIWYPTVFFGRWAKSTLFGIGKWLGYMDKWIVFPILLKLKLLVNTKNTRYHICDHSNAPYLALLPKQKTVITCHDVLAIQGALGFPDTYCPASVTGKIYQRWILHFLSRAERLASVSLYTLKQLQSIVSHRNAGKRNWMVIPNAFNANFYPMPENERQPLLEKFGLLGKPFLLHVGSSLPRKNRVLLLDMVASIGDKWGGNICFAGEKLDQKITDRARSLGIEERIVSVPKPEHIDLVALYSGCKAFVFPSFSEGFGWPIIEAQACGAPVIASNLDPLPEVSGDAALHADPQKPEAFAEAFLLLEDENTKVKLIKEGFENCKRFDSEKIINQYLKLHGVK